MTSVLIFLMICILYFAVRLGKFEHRIDEMEIVMKSVTNDSETEIKDTAKKEV